MTLVGSGRPVLPEMRCRCCDRVIEWIGEGKSMLEWGTVIIDVFEVGKGSISGFGPGHGCHICPTCAPALKDLLMERGVLK